MSLSRTEILDIYRRRAKRYDVTANLYYLLGFREWAYRKKAVSALRLRPGATVVEIGCGTGLNFSLLRDAVGPDGQVIGVDMTPEMLDRARARVAREGWDNVSLVQCAASEYDFPNGVGGVISTFALTLVPGFDDLIRRAARALPPGGRFVVGDLKLPDGWARSLFPLLLPLFRPFGVTADLAARHPWESLRRRFPRFGMREFYFGYTYVAWGEA